MAKTVYPASGNPRPKETVKVFGAKLKAEYQPGTVLNPPIKQPPGMNLTNDQVLRLAAHYKDISELPDVVQPDINSPQVILSDEDRLRIKSMAVNLRGVPLTKYWTEVGHHPIQGYFLDSDGNTYKHSYQRTQAQEILDKERKTKVYKSIKAQGR